MDKSYFGRNILSIYVVEWYMTYVCVWIFTSALGAWKINYIIFHSFFCLCEIRMKQEKPPKSPSYEHINKLSSHNTIKWQSMSFLFNASAEHNHTFFKRSSICFLLSSSIHSLLSCFVCFFKWILFLFCF